MTIFALSFRFDWDDYVLIRRDIVGYTGWVMTMPGNGVWLFHTRSNDARPSDVRGLENGWKSLGNSPSLYVHFPRFLFHYLILTFNLQEHSRCARRPPQHTYYQLPTPWINPLSSCACVRPTRSPARSHSPPPSLSPGLRVPI